MLGPPARARGRRRSGWRERRSLPRISTGDILREAVQAGTPLGSVGAGDDGRRPAGQRRRDDRDRRRAARPRRRARAGSCSTAFRARSSRRRRSIDDGRTRRRWSCSTSSCPRTCWCGGWRRAASAAAAASNAAVRLDDACEKCGGALVARDGRRRRDRAGAPEGVSAAEQAARGLLLGAATFRAINGNQPADVVTAAVEARDERGGRGGRRQRCDRLQVAARDRADAARPTRSWRTCSPSWPSMVRAGRDDGGSGRGGGAAGARGGRRAGVQGLSRLSGDALRVGERRGRARHPGEPRAASRATSSRSTWA